MEPFLGPAFGNPSSVHSAGRAARRAVENAREEVASLLGAAAPEEIVFTSGGTEANNLAIRGVAEAASTRRRIVTSVIEHPATTMPCRHLETKGWQIEWSPVDGEARVRLDHLGERMSEATLLVTIMHANNETGTMQPIREIAELAHARGALVHTDAAQSVGKVAVNVGALGVDLLTVAGHKLNAPKGVGALFVRRGTALRPFVLGAGHERGLRPGTENVASIVGLGVACEVAARTVETKTLAATPEGVFYAAMPYPGCAGCMGGLAVLPALTSTSSHELCEAITDPIPGQGWYDDANGEIGDICAWKTKQLGAYTVQLEWSNTAGNCI